MKITNLQLGRGGARYSIIAESFRNVAKSLGPEKWTADREIETDDLMRALTAIAIGYVESMPESDELSEDETAERVKTGLVSMCGTSFAVGFETALNAVENGHIFSRHDWELPDELVNRVRQETIGESIESAQHVSANAGIELRAVKPDEPEWAADSPWVLDAEVDGDGEVVAVNRPKKTLA